MDLLIILTYVAFAWAMFKIFKIPVNKWTIPTAALGGIFIVSGLILLMNYNHPYTFKAQKAVISIPVVPQVTGVVIEVTDKKNTLIKKGEVLFRLDPTRYQARVDRLMADIVTAEHKQRALGAELDEMAANTQQAKATRDKFAKEYQRYARGSQAKVNPFSERDIDVARQNYLAQEASVKSSAAEQKQIQSQLDSLVLGEHSQIASLKAQLAEAKYNLEQTIVRAPSDGYVTQVLIRPGTYAASLPLRPVMVFIPDQKRQIVAQFRQNSLLRLAPGDDAEVVFNALPGKVFSGKLAAISPAVPGGAYQSTGTLQTLNTAPGSDGVIATIELDEHTDLSALPDGIYAQVAVYSDHFIQHILDPPGLVFPFTEDSHQIQPPFIRGLKAGHQRAVLQIALHTFVWRKHNTQVISCQLQRRLRVIANVISLHAIIPHLFTPGDVEAPDIRVINHHRVDQNTGVMFEFVRTANRMFLKIALAGISGYGILCNKTGNQRFIFWWSVAD